MFKEIVFLLALFYSKEQSSMMLVPVDETPKASMVDETSAKFLMKSEFLILKRDYVVAKMTPPNSLALF